MKINPIEEGTITFAWTDSLREWIETQEGEPVNPPDGYTVTVELKEVRSGDLYTLLAGHEDISGSNEVEWDGNPLPDGPRTSRPNW